MINLDFVKQMQVRTKSFAPHAIHVARHRETGPLISLMSLNN
jgi:hypothetical protein